MGIGALVIYSTIARMVEEQQKLVGTVKAMGFYNREVSFKYLFFGVGATVIGVLLGILFSYFAMQKLLLFAEGIPLTFGTVPSIFLPVPTLTVLAGALALSVLAVLFAALFRRHADGRSPAEGDARRRPCQFQKEPVFPSDSAQHADGFTACRRHDRQHHGLLPAAGMRLQPEVCHQPRQRTAVRTDHPL